jgi:hypothetical protein
LGEARVYVDAIKMGEKNGINGISGISGIRLTEPTLHKGSKPKGSYITPDPNEPRPITR